MHTKPQKPCVSGVFLVVRLAAHVSNDLEMIESASIDVYEADYEVLITFVSYFDTELINAEEVQQWIKECDPKNEECAKV